MKRLFLSTKGHILQSLTGPFPHLALRFPLGGVGISFSPLVDPRFLCSTSSKEPWVAPWSLSQPSGLRVPSGFRSDVCGVSTVWTHLLIPSVPTLSTSCELGSWGNSSEQGSWPFVPGLSLLRGWHWTTSLCD